MHTYMHAYIHVCVCVCVCIHVSCYVTTFIQSLVVDTRFYVPVYSEDWYGQTVNKVSNSNLLRARSDMKLRSTNDHLLSK